MAKKMKLNLEDLKVQSFVTTLKEEENNEVKGGLTGTNPACLTQVGCSNKTNCSDVMPCHSDWNVC